MSILDNADMDTDLQGEDRSPTPPRPLTQEDKVLISKSFHRLRHHLYHFLHVSSNPDHIGHRLVMTQDGHDDDANSCLVYLPPFAEVGSDNGDSSDHHARLKAEYNISPESSYAHLQNALLTTKKRLAVLDIEIGNANSDLDHAQTIIERNGRDTQMSTDQSSKRLRDEVEGSDFTRNENDERRNQTKEGRLAISTSSVVLLNRSQKAPSPHDSQRQSESVDLGSSSLPPWKRRQQGSQDISGVRRLGFGTAYAGALLNDMKKNEQDETSREYQLAQVEKQRRRMEKESKLKRLQAERSELESFVFSYLEGTILAQKRTVLMNRLIRPFHQLKHLLSVMPSMEERYASQFFLTTKPSKPSSAPHMAHNPKALLHIDINDCAQKNSRDKSRHLSTLPISWSPAQHTIHSRSYLNEQLQNAINDFYDVGERKDDMVVSTALLQGVIRYRSQIDAVLQEQRAWHERNKKKQTNTDSDENSPSPGKKCKDLGGLARSNGPHVSSSYCVYQRDEHGNVQQNYGADAADFNFDVYNDIIDKHNKYDLSDTKYQNGEKLDDEMFM